MALRSVFASQETVITYIIRTGASHINLTYSVGHVAQNMKYMSRDM